MDRINTLTELCEYLKNWFDDGGAVHSGKIEVAGGTLKCTCGLFGSRVIPLEYGQYFRVTGSPFYDGVHMYPDEEMADCTFEGSVTPMRVPQVILALVDDIQAWRDLYERADSNAMSPFNSESFAGYSYNKSGAGVTSATGGSGWQAVFKHRLSPWRKI